MRLLELCAGQDARKRVCPAEAGLICDACLVNVLGRTASPEGSLVASRSAMISP